MLAKKSTSAERMEKMREMLAECKANTTTLKKADGCSMFYSNIDFLTIKLTDGTELVNTLRGLSENSPNYECDNGLFKIQYE